MGARQRAGFTLVELLVVIAIIGMLVALSLPAISMVRETARRNNCQQNLREMARGVQQFELKKEKYPAAFADSPQPGVTPMWPWVAFVLPYIGEEKFYNELLANADLTAPVNQRSLQTLTCPSDSTVKKADPSLSYVGNMGTNDDFQTATFTAPDVADEYDVKANGVFHDRFSDPGNTSRPIVTVDETDIKDGAQYTLLLTENLDATIWTFYNPASSTSPVEYQEAAAPYHFGYRRPVGSTVDNILEYRFGVVWHPEAPLAAPVYPPVGHASTTVTIGFNRDPLDPPGPAVDADHARPSSYHPGGVNVAFVGGNVRFVDEEIDYITFRQIMGIEDSEAAFFDPSTNAFVWQTQATAPAWHNSKMKTLEGGNYFPFRPVQLDP